MYYDILSLRKFYKSKLGETTVVTLEKLIQKHYLPHKGSAILGLGYATPYLGLFKKISKDIISFMPARQGADNWPSTKKNLTALVDETCLPLENETIDYVLLIHMLEHTKDEHKLLQEIWRILTPTGRLIVIVPHRLSYWINREETPFGNGKPYSVNQIKKLLSNANFCYIKSYESLYKIPSQRWLSEVWLEKIRKLLPIFGGVLVIEAQKNLLQPIITPKIKKKYARTPILLPAQFSSDRAIYKKK